MSEKSIRRAYTADRARIYRRGEHVEKGLFRHFSDVVKSYESHGACLWPAETCVVVYYYYYLLYLIYTHTPQHTRDTLHG